MKKKKVPDPVSVDVILQEYDRLTGTFEEFRKKVDLLMLDILKHHSVSFHKVESRIKTRESLKKKSEDKNKYANLEGITDIVGFRIILFFKEDVDFVKDILKEEFEQLESFTSDRRIHNVNEFGYTSLHIVLRLNRDRRGLLEYRQFPDIKFEVQLRTILQHSWAEIEHDLGYKARINIPGEIPRSFARLAGLIELADEEFSRIRTTIKSFESTTLNFPEIKADPLSLDTLNRFIENSSLLESIAERVAVTCKMKVVASPNRYLATSVLSRLEYCFYRYVFEVKDELQKYELDIVDLAIVCIGVGKKGLFLTKSVGLFYLCLFKFLQEEKRDFFEHYCRDYGITKKVREKATIYYDGKYGDG